MVRFSTIFIILFSLSLIQTDAFKVNCSRGWTPDPRFGVCLRAYSMAKTYKQAKAFCSGSKRVLVKIWDYKMNNIVKKMIQKLPKQHFYIGLKKERSGHFNWRGDNFEAVFTRWFKRKDDRERKKCVAFRKQDSKWINVRCTARFGFICEENKELCPADFMPNQYSGTCVRYFDTAETWSSATKTCARHKSELVRIQGSKGQDMINFLKAHAGFISDGRAWLGLHDPYGNETFRWLDYEEKVYVDRYWSPGEPKRPNGTEQCVYMRTGDGKWVSDDCSHKIASICERFAACSKQTYGMFCPKTCSSNSCRKCNPWTGACITVRCPSGYYGASCQKACAGRTYGRDCLRQCSINCGGADKDCDKRDGHCLQGCVPGYQGEKCDKACSPGKYGLNCSKQCSSNCGGNDSLCGHRDGYCLNWCRPGYQGKRCDIACPHGTYGQNCSHPCNINCGGPNSLCNNLNGDCLNACDEGYQGRQCDSACPHGKYGHNCSHRCNINCGGPNSLCNNRNGDCLNACDEGYQGRQCDSECPDGTYGLGCLDRCSINCRGPDNACYKHNGKCLFACDDGYRGDKCNSTCSATTYGKDCSQQCNDDCGGPNNTCDHRNGHCLDSCDPGYKGQKCDLECSDGTYGRHCSQRCHENCAGPHKPCDKKDGRCLFRCINGYKGDKCEELITYSFEAILSASIFAFAVLLFCLMPMCDCNCDRLVNKTPAEAEVQMPLVESNHGTRTFFEDEKPLSFSSFGFQDIGVGDDLDSLKSFMTRSDSRFERTVV